MKFEEFTVDYNEYMKYDRDPDDIECQFCHDVNWNPQSVELVEIQSKSSIYYSWCCERYFRLRYLPENKKTKSTSIQTVLFEWK